MEQSIIIASAGMQAEVATLGAELIRLTDGAGAELLWDGDPAVWSGHAPILFPVIGCLAGGQYRLGGQVYAMPKHGFARRSHFVVVEQSDSAVTLRLEDDPQTRAIYPFAFRLDIAFTIAGGALTMCATVTNRGDTPLPASFGFHPALRWPLPYGAPRSAHAVTFAVAEPEAIRRIDGDGLLDPVARPTPVAGRRLALRDGLFVADALIFDRLRSRSLRYGAGHGPALDIAFENLPDLGIWTKPGAGYICIEPWQGHADPAGFAGDFHDKPGIVTIVPGAALSFTMHIALSAEGT